MSSSIQIPSRTQPANPTLPLPLLDPCALAQSLPTRATSLFPHIQTSPSPHPFNRTAQDDIAITSSVELITPAARQYSVRNVSRTTSNFNPHPCPSRPKNSDDFQSWDFGELVLAADRVGIGMKSGSTVARRPPRPGVSGTYFFCEQDHEEHRLGVFKPMDEEAQSIDMSPPPSFPSFLDNPAADFSLGPAAHNGLMSPPATSPPHSAATFFRAASVSSDSENDSRTCRSHGFHQGEGAYREVAAYLMDHDRFARVPQTALLQWLKPFEPLDYSAGSPTCSSPPVLSDPYSDYRNFPEFEQSHQSVRSHSNSLSEHSSESGPHSDSDSFAPEFSSNKERTESNLQTKKGAFQVYVPNLGDADDFGPGVFDKDQVHRIAVLDIRTLNHDRHGGNILVAKSKSPNRRYDLVPIDHGYILPDVIQSISWPIWMDWPMTREPISEEIKRYINYLDAELDARRLNEELDGVFRLGALQGLKIATALLQKGVAAGLTLYDIGQLMYSRREEPTDRSELEKIVSEASETSLARERHITQQQMLMSNGVPDEAQHRRHQSMNAFETHETFASDFVVKFASRRIHELVNRVAAAKMKAQQNKLSRGFFLSRARSIPDFGLGEKPVHAIIHSRSTNEDGEDVPMPTPASSPMAVSNAKSRHSQLECQLPAAAAPIQVPINDRNVMRIALPEPRRVVKEHSLEHDEASSDVKRLHSGGLPPVPASFKEPNRKASPVSPMDMFKWNGASQS